MTQPERRSPAVEYAERSDPGRDPEKQVNEDACGHRETPFGHLCVVCDGMGGHAAGREAAELSLATIFEMFEGARDDAAPGQVLSEAIEEASHRAHVMPTGEVSMGRPGSTVVAVLLHARGTEVAHVGDSRAYLVHEGKIVRLTRDHSIVQELVDRGLLTPQQAAHHPEANRITRALGMSGDVHTDLRAPPVHHVTGDAFVLCSDGLSDLVEDGEILEIVGAEPAAQAVGKLVDLANARGGHDNITVVVLRARETAIGATSGVAPTVALGGTTQAEPPAASPSTTTATAAATATTSGAKVVEGPLPEALDPALRAPDLRRPLEPTPPAATHSRAPGRRPGPGVIAGLSLAVLAVVVLVGVLVDQLAERAGKRNATTWPTGLDLPSSDAARDGPTSLEPEIVPAPTAIPPSEPIVPLDPVEPSPRRHRR